MTTQTNTPKVTQSSFWRLTRLMLMLPVVLLVAVLLLIGVLLIYSPGQAKPFLDESGRPLANSLSEKIRVPINGVPQGMFIKSKNVANPVLLYLHGGMPEYFLTQQYPTGLEEDFTVVWWDQRGAGLSFRAAAANETITTEQLISDTLALTNYLRARFHQDKIYLMGHSGGTFIGIQAAARAPELYHAYIGVAQVSNQRKSEQLAYDYMLKQYRANGNAKMVQQLEAAPVSETGIAEGYWGLRDPAMHSLGIGTIHTMDSVVTGIFFPSLAHPEYTALEKINLWRGKIRSGVSAVWREIVATDLAQQTPSLTIPVYFLEGQYDYTCSYSEAKKYFEQLQAPVKGFYTFTRSAHSPPFEEPEKTRHILRADVLQGVNDLADPLSN